MLTRRRFLSGLVLSSLAQNGFASPSSQSVLKQLQKIDANILLMRHALAPGFGDPNGFDITQCCTQRNLDSRGRKQAAARGQDFRNSGVKFDAIYSSQWCRCMETAKLLNMGAVQPFAGLNSFFEEYAERVETLQKLEQRFSTLNANALSLMVTHQVVIQAVSKLTVSSGQCVGYNVQTKQAIKLRID